MKRSPLRRRAPKRSDDAEVRRAWALPVKARPCTNCGSRERVQAHHVIAQRQLKWMNRPDLLWDPRNAMALCERCHERHESAFDRIRGSLLSPDNHEFARQLDLDWYIERHYARDEDEGSRHPRWT